MLVLSRYKDQSIYIGDDIVVTIVDVRGDRIRLGVEAPPDVPVHRQEIYEEIQRNKGANGSSEASTQRDVRERSAVSDELDAVRRRYGGSTAIVIGRWVSESEARRLEKALNMYLEWLPVGYSERELSDVLERPDVSLFIVQEPRGIDAGRFAREAYAAGKNYVSYKPAVLTAEKIAQAIMEQTGPGVVSRSGSSHESRGSSRNAGPLGGRRTGRRENAALRPYVDDFSDALELRMDRNGVSAGEISDEREPEESRRERRVSN